MNDERESGFRIFDFDGAFDGRIAEHLKKTRSKRTEEEWEDVIPTLYKQFGDTVIGAIGCSPNQYYRRMSAERIAQEVKEHFSQNVPVDGFLRSALEEEKNREVLYSLLRETADEAALAVELLADDKAAYDEYIRLLLTSDSDELRESIADILKEDADAVATRLVGACPSATPETRQQIADILCQALIPQEEIYAFLLQEFKTAATGETGRAAERLARYGDERALPYIKEKAEAETVDYLDWRELKNAAEALGGSVSERDFSSDKAYRALRQAEEKQREEREKQESKR